MTAKEQMSRFLALLFPEGVIEIRTLGQYPKRVMEEDVNQLISHAMEMDQNGLDVYFGVLSRDRVGHVVGSVRYVWADLDDKIHGREAVLLAAGRTADILVDSGNGIHAYWKLTRPIELTEENRRVVRNCLRVFQQKILPGCDNTSDLARLLRLPGTRNHKDAESPKGVRLLYVRGEYVDESVAPYVSA